VDQAVREVVAVLAGQMVAVPGELEAQLVDDALHVRAAEVCVAQQDALPEPEVLAQLGLPVAGLDLEDARHGELVAPKAVLAAIELDARVEEAYAQRHGVVICIDEVVDVEHHRLPGQDLFAGAAAAPSPPAAAQAGNTPQPVEKHSHPAQVNNLRARTWAPTLLMGLFNRQQIRKNFEFIYINHIW